MIALVIHEGRVVQEFSCDPEDWCQGIRSGETGAMCGGCDGCCIAQAEHSGYQLEYIHSMSEIEKMLNEEEEKVDWKESGF